MVKKWTEEEEQFLRDNYRSMSNSKLAKALGRTKHSVDGRIKKLNLKRRAKRKPSESRRWTVEEDAFLESNYMNMPHAKIAKALNRTVPSIRMRCKGLGFTKSSPSMWTDEEDQFLRGNYKDLTYQQIADKLGKKLYVVSARCRELELVKKPQKARREWAKDEIRYLQRNYKTTGITDMAFALKRPYVSVVDKLRQLKLRKERQGITKQSYLEFR